MKVIQIQGIREVKELSRIDTWCTIHKNCFRYGSNETDDHVLKKFERFRYWRSMGAVVFTELILNSGLRPDLVIINCVGDIMIEEIVASEKIESMEKKSKDYPFTVAFIKTKE